MQDSRCFLSTPSSKFKPVLASSVTRSSHQDSLKTKSIARAKINRCPQKCKKHLFSFVKDSKDQEHSTFSIHKYGVNYWFCPTYNQFISEFEGGAPEFNADRNIYTPTFVSKLTNVSNHQTANKIYKERFRENLAKATNSTAEDSKDFRFGIGSPEILKKIKGECLNQVMFEYKQILRAKDERQSQKINKMMSKS